VNEAVVKRANQNHAIRGAMLMKAVVWENVIIIQAGRLIGKIGATAV
jgi:hypothetical protein